MATRCTITVLGNDGKYRTIYCHWDGYPDGVGKSLLAHYQTEEARNALIALGNLSSLGKSTDCPDGHTFAAPVDGYCVAYARDHGETHMGAVETDVPPGMYEDFNYLWDGIEWLVCWRTLAFGPANLHKAGSYHPLASVVAHEPAAEGAADGLDHLGLAELPLGALAI